MTTTKGSPAYRQLSLRYASMFRAMTSATAASPTSQVHAIYEPKQECSSEEIVLLDDAEGEERISQLAQMTGLHRVGLAENP